MCKRKKELKKLKKKGKEVVITTGRPRYHALKVKEKLIYVYENREILKELSNEGLIKVEYEGQDYFLCKEENILAVVEE